MNAWFAWLEREWRGQRQLLLALGGIVFATLTLVFLIRPPEHGAWMVAMFVAAGTVAALAVVTPELVRAEFTAGRDHLVRRLPGALLPSLSAKLSFALFAMLLFAVFGFVVGELVLALRGLPLEPLAEVVARGPLSPVAALAVVAVLPWLFAVASWMPEGRMALGASALLALAVTLSFEGFDRWVPGLRDPVSPVTLLPWLLALGLVVAGVSWLAGRSGGDHRRSARLGAAAAIAGAVPTLLWLVLRALVLGRSSG